MKEDKRTREELLRIAKQEFLEKGYHGASLRNICKQAGVTTGALYFFFQDKEDLFANIVEPHLQSLYQYMQEHFQKEEHFDFAAALSTHNDAQDYSTSVQIIRYLYQYHDEFLLLLTKSQGSRFEHIKDQFIEINEKHYRALSDEITKATGKEAFDPYVLHWISHVIIDMFIHVLVHEPSVDQAEEYIKAMTKYNIGGFYELLREKLQQ